jgi:hypothetical protein
MGMMTEIPVQARAITLKKLGKFLVLVLQRISSTALSPPIPTLQSQPGATDV